MKAKEKSVDARALAWIVGDHTGLSSKAIWAHMMGAPTPKYGWNYPHDPADFGRCLRLLRLIPEWRERLPEMRRRGDVWKKLVTHWQHIEDCMEREVGWDWSKGRAAIKTYEMMKSIGC